MARRRLRRHCWVVASLCAVSVGLNEPNSDRFVVRLAIEDESGSSPEEESQSTSLEPDLGSSIPLSIAETTGAFPTRHTVNVSIHGHSFQCRLPASDTRSRERQQSAVRHVALMRSASLAGHCFKGSDSELCVGDHVSVGDATATHVAGKDVPIDGGGFQQQYSGAGEKPLHVLVQCRCSLPELNAVPEPPCKPGDLVLAPRIRSSPDGDVEVMEKAFIAANLEETGAPDEKGNVQTAVSDSEGPWITVLWHDPPWPRAPWDKSGEPLQPAEGRMMRRSKAVALDGSSCSSFTLFPQEETTLDGIIGKIGVLYGEDSGEVLRIMPDSQADRLGVKPGWLVHKINGEAFSSELFQKTNSKQDPYSVTFIKRTQWEAPTFASASPMPEILSSSVQPAASGGEASEQATFDFGIQLSAVSCCGLRDLRSSATDTEAPKSPASTQLEFQRLLAPLTGQCLSVLAGWWTYELCWPWRLRQIHTGINGEVEGPGILLGRFNTSKEGLVLQKAAVRQDGQRMELVTQVEGDTCEVSLPKWIIQTSSDPSSAEEPIEAAGGSFNPTQIRRVEGKLAKSELNADGCTMFDLASEPDLEGSLLLVKRGHCWFHTKALNAQAVGAVGIIVYNEAHQMVNVMEGVDELPASMIPTVLVERAPGRRLLEMVGTKVTIEKDDEGLNVARPISTSITFRCSADWYSRSRVCQVGDEVDVKLPPPEGTIPASQWPRSAIQILKASIDRIFDENNTLQVTWGAVPEGEDPVQELQSVIPQRIAFYEGAPCNSVGSSRIEFITDSQYSETEACHTEFSVHVAELCAHRRLAPPPPRDPQVISCAADESTKDAIAKQREEARLKSEADRTDAVKE